jgi:hypothetical protein
MIFIVPHQACPKAFHPTVPMLAMAVAVAVVAVVVAMVVAMVVVMVIMVVIGARV